MGNKLKNASCHLMFSAMSEIMLSMYENTSLIKDYDPSLEAKLRNLKVHFERTTKKGFLRFNEEEQLVYMRMITIFEELIHSSSDRKKFHELVEIIASSNNGKLTIINNHEELVNEASRRSSL
jgi:hypothetical protein